MELKKIFEFGLVVFIVVVFIYLKICVKNKSRPGRLK